MDEVRAALKKAIEEGVAKEAAKAVQQAIDAGADPGSILRDVMVPAMDEVGRRYECGDYFLPEMLISARAMKEALAILRPRLIATDVKPAGKVVAGTVKGDLHDIGKNLVCMMLEGAGFEVVDLGVNTDAEKFIAALEEHRPDILGMSALLTTTMPYMKVVIQTLKDRGIRDDYVVLVGGAPLNEEFGAAIGADAYCRDAAIAAETARAFIEQRRGAGA
jgi:methylmalonyl-CoA mutase cobalamin-binding domain/chain